MDSPLQRLSAWSDGGLVNVIVDTPKGSRNKYKLDEDSGLFRLAHVLPAGMAFPYDFGSIPSTRAEDGDPLDVLILAQAPAVVGCLVTARLIGTIRGKQTEKRKTFRNDRLLAVPVTKVNEPEFTRVDDVPAQWIEQIEHFFVSYNEAHGRKYAPTGVSGPDRARAAVEAAARRFRRPSP